MTRTITADHIEETAVYPLANLTLVRVVHLATGAVLEGKTAGVDHDALVTARQQAFDKMAARLAA